MKERITKEELEKLARSCVNYSELGEELGVSPSSARNLLIENGIPLPYRKVKGPPDRPLFGRWRRRGTKQELDFK